MKIRHGFVSNSSSSSFTCDITQRTESGWDDVCMSDIEMYQCEHGHMMDDTYVEGAIEELAAKGIDHVVNVLSEEFGKELEERYREEAGDYSTRAAAIIGILGEIGDDYDFRCDLPESLCPLCSLRYVSQQATLRYLLMKMGRTFGDVCEEIRKEYGGNPGEFDEAIRSVSLDA